MERKIDEIFDFFETKVKCVDSKNRHCSDCWFLNSPYCYMYTSLIGECKKKNCSDKNSIHFELINKIKKNMKPFNIKEYNDNPSRKVITREGRPVRILCTNARRSYPVVALIEDEEDYLYAYLPNGKICGSAQQHDLFFAPEKCEGFINLYKNICGGISTDTVVFSTKEHAQASKKYENYLDTIKIEWEE